MSYTLSIIIPCFNEKATIERLLEKVKSSPVKNKQIIVVDDGSTDGTRDLLSGKLNTYIDLLELHKSNQGKGAAIRTGISKADGDYIIIQDADMEYSPKDYSPLIDHLEKKNLDFVYGSRIL